MPSGNFEVSQTPAFGRIVKKLKKQEKKILDTEVKKLVSDPMIGELKRGNLAGIKVHQFKMNKQMQLLSYTENENGILLIMFGSHENFYRDLHRYMNRS